MISYDIAAIINKTYEQIVHYNEQFLDNEGIYFKCCVEAECRGYEMDSNTHHPEWEGNDEKDFHIIFINPHKVFICITKPSIAYEIPAPSEWKNKSNHDSCWRDVAQNELTKLMFSIHDTAFINLPNKYKKKKSDEVRFSLGLSVGGKIFQLIKVEMEPAYELDGSGYHKKLTAITPIKKLLSL